ncbi:gp47 [Bacillus phage G]|uniref:Gp47 n=1 Tax=Bacillus phage G TaxID=2884420 RepID=G3MBB7_9CAUD|nr:gp47 [Bacillus phage G]AEO93318.1 gp47 [Bacillus phage G]
MKKVEEYTEIMWEVVFLDSKGKLIDLWGNTENEDEIELLKERAMKKGYDCMEVSKITKEAKRYKL